MTKVFVLVARWRGEETSSLLGVFSSEAKAKEFLARPKASFRDYVTMHVEGIDEPYAFGDEDTVTLWGTE